MADMKKVATRDSYGNALKELGAVCDNLVVLDADLAGATKTGIFQKAFPQRHFDCGIAEANMICMAAAHYKLDNLVVIVDNNGLQIDGDIAKVMSPYPIVDKLAAFGFHVEAIDGHDFDAIEAAMNTAKATKGQPTAIVMKTTKGKDISYMENNAGWHGKAPNDAEYEQAMTELKAILTELEGA